MQDSVLCHSCRRSPTSYKCFPNVLFRTAHLSIHFSLAISNFISRTYPKCHAIPSYTEPSYSQCFTQILFLYNMASYAEIMAKICGCVIQPPHIQSRFTTHLVLWHSGWETKLLNAYSLTYWFSQITSKTMQNLE